MRNGVYGLVIQEGKLLVLRRKRRNYWILPGGEKEEGETDEECLSREFMEELPGLHITNSTFYGSFTNKTPRSKRGIHGQIYLMETYGEFGESSGEIKEGRFISNPLELKLSPLTEAILNSLKEERRIR